jgi:hypothetical protein
MFRRCTCAVPPPHTHTHSHPHAFCTHRVTCKWRCSFYLACARPLPSPTCGGCQALLCATKSTRKRRHAELASCTSGSPRTLPFLAAIKPNEMSPLFEQWTVRSGFSSSSHCYGCCRCWGTHSLLLRPGDSPWGFSTDRSRCLCERCMLWLGDSLSMDCGNESVRVHWTSDVIPVK